MSVILVCAALFRTAPATAAETQSEPDVQLRIPIHYQIPFSTTNDVWSRFSLAAWTVLSNITAKDNNAQSLLVGGLSYDYGAKGSWIELLGGAKLTQDGYRDPLVNVRFLDKSFTRLSLSGDLEYFPRLERGRFYALLAADTPIRLWEYTFRLGVESENIFSFSGKDDSLGIGPRVVFPLPIKIHPSITATFTVGYEFRNDRDFVRGYFAINYRPKKK